MNGASFGWRAAFVLGGLLYFRGSSQHPRADSMAEMMRDPIWVQSHSTILVGLVVLTIGLVLFRRSQSPSPALPTPVATTHGWLATLIYPLFAIALFGLVRAGMQTRELGSVWIGWLGFIGAVAHGVVMLLVVHLGIGEAGILFPIAAR